MLSLTSGGRIDLTNIEFFGNKFEAQEVRVILDIRQLSRPHNQKWTIINYRCAHREPEADAAPKNSYRAPIVSRAVKCI